MTRARNKVALVTGAARGQGRSHALRLAREGADIIAVDICRQIATVPYPMPTEEDLAETARLVEETDRRIVTAVADVRDLDELTGVVDDAVERLGRLDIVAANAGIHSGGVPTWEMDDQMWQDLVDVNLTGVWITCKVAVPHLIAAGGGSIVITSSVAGMRPFGGIAHYVSAKHALMGLTKTLAQELGQHNIRVNAVNPTQVDTPMIMNPLIYQLFLPDVPEPTKEQFAVASQEGMLLPTPWVEPSDVSDALVFLSSDEARFITGIGLPVDAGVLAK
ncbi:mycofactocin-coupled SDR family oxidoreductase [Cryptosporangium arvum]|uniref:Oxidoreductase, SDR family n=1 Tax=Cryptosporangium arvum DSM 44712 TaxID=927661 RepID=A0A010ZTR4_9ACTN|nr:mycofactocin-coupled SDR family oxidoreductase [Cryptosporangium arvum]EXG82094.1 oxidoreductase, SDR family [Cryptosporangium arvum DSM 44712]